MVEQFEVRVGYIHAANLMGMPYDSFRQWVRRRRVPTFRDPTNRKGKMVRLSDLPEGAKERHNKECATRAVAGLSVPPGPTEQPVADISIIKPELSAKPARPPQAAFHFEPQIRTQGAIDQAVAAIPLLRKKWVQDWCETVAMCTNGTWKKYKASLVGGRAVKKPADFRAWMAEQKGVSTREIRRKVALYRAIKKRAGKNEESAFREFAEQLLPKPKSGRQSVFAKPGNEWMGITLINFYLNQAQLSVVRARQLLMQEIDAKQKAWKLGHYYERPTLRQCRIALRNVSRPQEILGRLGDKAYNDKCAPYISRDPDSLRSNDVWVTDQKLSDVRVRGDGEQLGRIWVVSFLDVRSLKEVGYWFGPVLSSDIVMSAAAMAIGRHGVPKSILMDLGKEFQCTSFQGAFRRIKGESLLSEAQGLCQRLGIEVIDAIGRNPQTKPIERWHREASRFDHNIPGWCGGNTKERPEVLAELERQHQEWKSTGRGKSPLWTIQEYLYAFVDWIENGWNAEHHGRGKYLRGMTPNECWNTHLPEGGVRRVSAAELELATADHRVLKVARGGQINITVYGQTIEYQAPELFLRQEQLLEVIVSRRSLRKIIVLDKAEDGRFLCEATAKPLFHWGQRAPEDREEVRQAIRMRNAARKAISMGNAARRVLEVTATPAEIGPQRPPMREISSTEFKSRKLKRLRAPKTMTTNDLAREVFEGSPE